MDKREAIMNAALELFAERSFHATPVPLIAKTAQVGAGTIYRYFKDKEDLFLELYVHWRGQFFEAIGKDLSTDIPLRAIFHEIWKRKVDFALANRNRLTQLKTYIVLRIDPRAEAPHEFLRNENGLSVRH
jgi:AcrR family transcriptional regulator